MVYKCILLNGPSSSGKSTLAKSLQTYIEQNKKEKYEIISIDDYLKMSVDSPIEEDDVFEISHYICERALEVLKADCGVIIDHVITSERIYIQLLESLKEYNIIKVRVTCPLHELAKREMERKDRCVGSAEASYKYLYPEEGYDLTVNTFTFSTEECSQKIYQYLS